MIPAFRASTVRMDPSATPENPGHTGFARDAGARWLVVAGPLAAGRAAWAKSDGGERVSVPIVPYLVDAHPANVFGFGLEIWNRLATQLDVDVDLLHLILGDRYESLPAGGQADKLVRIYAGIACRVRR